MSLAHVSDRQIESRLWDAANILSGPMDASDFAANASPAYSLNRICDVYDEERAAVLAECGGDAVYASLPEQHCFQSADGRRWY